MYPLLMSFTLLTVASSLSNYPIVQTSYGAVRGYEYEAKNGFVSEIYKKIPYASAPTGSKRWKKPVPPEAWNYTLDGTFFGPNCVQVGSFMYSGYVTGFSEDCLTLVIYTSKQCRESNASCPVVHYIHGGGEIFGGITYGDERLATNFPAQGVVLVNVNFRLGPFGVMALGDENVLPANLAMHDVLESLHFVRKEIHAFGGDKDQITVMGHSSAATMALAFVFSPAINKPESPLFARAIAGSGTASYESEEKQVDVTHRVAAKLGCSGTAREVVDCLMPLDTEEILKAAREVSGTDVMTEMNLSGVTIAGELMPIHNTKELRDQQMEHMSKFAQPTKLIVGSTMYEFNASPNGTRKVGPDSDGLSDDGRVQALDVLGVQNIEECVEKYFRDVKSGSFEPGSDTISQGLFLTTALFAQAQSRAGGEVYVYSYDYPVHGGHAADVFYVIGAGAHPVDENEQWLSRVYPLYFTNFVKGLPLAPDWTPLDPSLMNYYSVNKNFTNGVSPRMKLGYHRNIYEYYNEMEEYDEQLSLFKRQLFDDPIQMRNITVDSSDPFNLRDVLFYLTIVCVVLFILYKMYHCYRDRRSSVGETSQLIDR